MTGAYKIDYIELPSQDGPKSREFFAAAFGWGGIDYGPSYHGIAGAGIDLGLQADPAEAPAAPLVIVRTSDLEATERAVVQAGGTITRPAFDFPGGRRFHFREPGGNEMAVWIERP